MNTARTSDERSIEVQSIFIGITVVSHADFESREIATEYKNISYYSLVNPGICSYEEGNIFNEHKRVLYSLMEQDHSMTPKKYESFIQTGFVDIREQYISKLRLALPRSRDLHRALTSYTPNMFHHDFNSFRKGLYFLEPDKEEHNNGVYITSLLLKINGKWNTIPYYCPHIDEAGVEFDSKSQFNILHAKNRLKLINILGKYGVSYKKSEKRRFSRTESHLDDFTEFLQDFTVKTNINILDLSCNNPTGAAVPIPAIQQVRLAKQFI